MSKRVIDLFSGCGGFSLAAIQAGFTVGVSVDIDPILTSSYNWNFPQTKLVNNDISLLTGEQLIKAGNGIPDGIIGGPPCQGFSLIGKRNKSDVRNELLFHFFRLVKEIRPKFFIMENVPGLMSSNSVGCLNEGLDVISDTYEIISPRILNAADCGAATNRKRVVVVGYDRRYCDEPVFPKKQKSVSVKDAIADLPTERMKPIQKQGFIFRRYRNGTSSYAEELKRVFDNNVGSKFAINMMRQNYVSGCSYTEHTPRVRQRFERLRQGETDPISRYMKLEWNAPSNTLRAGTGKEGGSFQAARPIHPYQNRVITVREAARIQGFPDWFLFHPTTWHSFRMIGNSVAPKMGYSILSEIYNCFDITPQRVA